MVGHSSVWTESVVRLLRYSFIPWPSYNLVGSELATLSAVVLISDMFS